MTARRSPWHPWARSSILLVAGDKAGQRNAWYRHAIPLAEIRRARGMTQQQVADKMGVTKGGV